MKNFTFRPIALLLCLFITVGFCIAGCDSRSSKKEASNSPKNLHGEIRLALGYKLEDILKGSAIENYDVEKHFYGWNGSLDIPAIDFYYDNARYGFEVPNAMLVGIRSNLWDESYRKSNDTNDLKVNLISILKRPLYDSFDDAVKEIEEWNIRFIDSGFIPTKHKYDLSIDEARNRLKEEIKGNQFPTFYVSSLMQDEVIFRLGISRAKNKLKPDSYVYNLNIVVKRPKM